MFSIETGHIEKGIGASLARHQAEGDPRGAVAAQRRRACASYRLHPSILVDLGLAEALKSECDRFSEFSAISVICEVEEVPRNGYPKTLRFAVPDSARKPPQHCAPCPCDGGACVGEAAEGGLETGPCATMAKASIRRELQKQAWARRACGREFVISAAISQSRARRERARGSEPGCQSGRTFVVRPKVLLADDHRIVAEGLKSLFVQRV